MLVVSVVGIGAFVLLSAALPALVFALAAVVNRSRPRRCHLLTRAGWTILALLLAATAVATLLDRGPSLINLHYDGPPIWDTP